MRNVYTKKQQRMFYVEQFLLFNIYSIQLKYSSVVHPIQVFVWIALRAHQSSQLIVVVIAFPTRPQVNKFWDQLFNNGREFH